MRKCWTMSLAGAALLCLNGCVLPPVVTIASYSVDIVTYEATGKTATDHIYSAIARSDCSFVRVLRRKPICVDPAPPATGTVVASQTTQPHPPEQETMPAGLVPRPTVHGGNIKVAIGSYLDQANAQRSVARYAPWHPAIANVTVGGQHFHRVVASSLSNDEAAALRARLAADQPSRLRLAQANTGNVVQPPR